MEEKKFYNIKTFSYIIDDSCIDYNIYEEEIKNASVEYQKIKDQIAMFDQLIELSNKEIAQANLKQDKEKKEKYESDKLFFIDKLIKQKMILNAKGSILSKLKFKDISLKELKKNIDRYNKRLNKINEMIKQYNYDIIYNEKNISDITVLSKFKESISRIVNFVDDKIETGIDLNTLKKYYNKVSDIDAYYKNDVITKKLKTDEDYKVIDINGFIFDINENDSIDSKKKKSKRNTDDEILKSKPSDDEIGDIDYIVYCEQVSGNIVRRHKKEILIK